MTGFLLVASCGLSFGLTNGKLNSEVTKNIPNSEWNALWDLFNSTNGLNWLWNDDLGEQWNFEVGANPCTDSWQGINCTVIGGDYHVDGIYLPHSNLDGSIPESMGNLAYLSSLILIDNYLNGTIPTTFGDLTYAEGIQLSYNYLSGPIPESLGSLTMLRILDLQGNDLNGTLPIALFDLHQLQVFDVFDCLFTGTLPDSLGNLASVVILGFSFNFFNGTLPPSIAQLSEAVFIDFNDNSLSGTIPSEIGSLPRLGYLILSLNNFRGSLPESMGSLHSLRILAAFNNSLTGSLPQSFAQLSNLSALALANNRLTGTLPGWLAALPELRSLVMSNNALRGTLPASWGNLSHLSDLQLRNNRIFGTIPPTYANLTGLIQFRLGGNLLFGSVPTCLAQLPLLQRLDLGSNRLRGRLPAELNQSTSLIELILSNNSLAGTIPSFLGGLTRLQDLELDGNSLSGTIPSSLSQLRNLTQLTLSGNDLHGTLEGVFDPATQRALSVVVVGQNRLSGTLPEEIFNLTALTNLVVSGNCFNGKLPDNICRATALNSLAMDGYQSSRDCKKPLVHSAVRHWLVRAYLVHDFVGGTFPTCLFTSLPSLNTLHLSSNGIGGTLPEGITISPALVYLSLSHNLLVGSIPASFQKKQWKEFDLSYNRLSGSLLSTFGTLPFVSTENDVADEFRNFWSNQAWATEPIIYDGFDGIDHILEIIVSKLQNYGRNTFVSRFTITNNQVQVLRLNNNRLSGHIPRVVQNRKQLSVLKGNLFDCKYDKSDLPKHDDTPRRRYTCGSSAFNVQYYAWLFAVVLCITVVVVVWRYRHIVERYIGIEYIYSHINMWLSVFTGAVTFPQYAGQFKLENVYSLDRLMNIVGYITLLCLAFIMLILAPLYLILAQSYSTYVHKYAWTVSAAYLSGTVPVALELCLLFVTLLIMMRGITTLNRFVLTIPQVQIDRMISLNVLAIDVSRLWRTKVLVYASFFVLNFVVVLGVNLEFVYVAEDSTSTELSIAQVWLSLFKVLWNNLLATKLLKLVHNMVGRLLKNPEEYSETKYVTIQVYTALLNNILIPCIVVAVQSSNCFLNVFETSKQTKALYARDYCEIYDPLAQVCILATLDFQESSYTPPFTYSYQCSSSLITSYVPAFVNVCLVTTFVIPTMYVMGQQWHRRATPGTLWYRFLQRSVPAVIRMSELEEEDDIRLTRMMTLQQHEVPNETLSMKYFHVNRLVINLVTQLAIMLTFGALFPPLAVAVGVSIGSTIYMEKLKVGRFLTAMIQKEKFKYVHIIELECQGLGSLSLLLKKSVWLLMRVKCWFYALVMFDTLGDKEGLHDAYWVFIVLPAIPELLYWSHRLYHRYHPEEGADGFSRPTDLSVSMATSMSEKSGNGAGSSGIGAGGGGGDGTSDVLGVLSAYGKRGSRFNEGGSTSGPHSPAVGTISNTISSSSSTQASRRPVPGQYSTSDNQVSAIELQEMQEHGGEEVTISALHAV